MKASHKHAKRVLKNGNPMAHASHKRRTLELHYLKKKPDIFKRAGCGVDFDIYPKVNNSGSKRQSNLPMAPAKKSCGG